MLLGVIAIAILPPYLIEKKFKKDSWMPTKEELEAYEAGDTNEK